MKFIMDADPVILKIPFVGIPLTWYGVIFAVAFYCACIFFSKILKKYLHILSISKADKVGLYVDKLLTYMILATIIGARLGHILFYEDIFTYLQNPMNILKTWEGGLASHGGIIAIIFSMYVFIKRTGKKIMPEVSFFRLLDLIAAPALFVGFAIRIGNFMNQEIIGPVTNLPWGVVFMRPSDHVEIAMRHPTQLYESAFYLFLCFFIVKILFTKRFLVKEGKISGLVLVLAFLIRLVLEPLKFEHSIYMQNSTTFFRMGQFLSIPFVLVGLYLFFRPKESSFLPHRLDDKFESEKKA